MVNWTKEQQEAIERRGTNLLVSAGAGSGKTAVLIQRILSRILDTQNPVDVDRLLIVTYTNAASVEMRHRLAKALYAASAADPENSRLAGELVLLQRAQITTLHSFCLDTIKKYFYLLDLDPKARIGNSAELLLLRESVLDKVFEDSYALENSSLELLLKHYSRGIGDENIKSLVLQLAEFSNSMANPEEWLKNLVQPYETGEIDSWLINIYDYLHLELLNVADLMAAALEICANPENGLSPYLQTIADETLAIGQLANYDLKEPKQDWDKLINALSSLEFRRLPGISKKLYFNLDAKEKTTELRKQVKDIIKKLQKAYGGKDYAMAVSEIKLLKPLAVGLVDLTIAYQKAWQSKKRSRKLLEFGDLEHYCLRLLQSDDLPVAADLQRQFVEVFVDEYQDINEVQESILVRVSQANNRFMVGDIKQSIYRFRMAEPTLFMKKFDYYGSNIGGNRIDLQQNFRSQTQVIKGVNFIFSQLMVGGNTEITYNDSAKLIPGNEAYPQLPIEMLILDQAQIEANQGALPENVAGEDFAEAPLGTVVEEATTALNLDFDDQPALDALDIDEAFTAASKEGQVIGKRILELQKAGREFKDIVILLRSVKNWSGLIKEELQNLGIPCQADGQDNYYESAEIQCLISLLKIIDNPLQDIELAAVLHSPLVGLSLAELAELRVLSPKSLYAAAELSPKAAVVEFLARLKIWRSYANQGSIRDLLAKILLDTGFLQIMGALPEGELRQANLASFLQFAKDYDKDNYKGLYRFLVFVDRNAKQGQAAVQTVFQPNAVTIMSVHRSKGLEFPVVFFAGLGKKFNEEDTKKDVLLHRHLGLGMRLVNLAKRIKYPTLSYLVLANKVGWETKAEELRILYVAMTRAKEQLILVGTAKSLASLCKKNGQVLDMALPQIPTQILGQNNNYLAWLFLALARHPACKKLLQNYDLAYPDQGLPLLADGDSKWDIQVITDLTSWGQPEKLENQDANLEASQEDKELENLGVYQEQNQKNWQAFLARQPIPQLQNQEQNQLRTQIRAAIGEKLSWVYPRLPLTTLPIKWSATGLNRLLQGESSAILGEAENQAAALGLILESDSKSDLIESDSIESDSIESDSIKSNSIESDSIIKPAQKSPEFFADLGTATHLLLEKVDLQALAAGTNPQKQMAVILAKAVAGGTVKKTVADAINLGKVSSFFETDLGKKLVEAQSKGWEICREQPFTLRLSLAELQEISPNFSQSYPDLAVTFQEEKVFFQGVIDLAFKTEAGWLLVDYKSGKNLNLSAEAVGAKYGSQLKLYEKAIQKICKEQVAEKYIYFTLNNRVVKI